jgi:acetylornithine deacetylase/succinyl-diaminopimelate desuccinylase-like protein
VSLADDVRDLMSRAQEDLAALVAIPSVADERQFPREHCLEAARLVAEQFAGAGLGDLHELETPDGYPAVFGSAPGPAGAPTVLLYCHYDVQPPLGEAAWETPPFALTSRDDGRWYGRGAADDKGGVVTHLTALRALGAGDFPVTLKLIAEGAEEQGSAGLDTVVAQHRDLLAADVIAVADGGNFAAGEPTLTTTLRGIANVVVTVRSLRSAMHSGMFGGAAPDALVALVRMLATLHDDDGTTRIRGLPNDMTWDGEGYPPERYRADATMLDGVDVIGDGTVADMLWSRYSVNVLGIDCPPVVGATAAVHPEARAAVSLRVPPGRDEREALEALTAHLQAVAPWNVHLDISPGQGAAPFRARDDRPAFAAMRRALGEAYGKNARTAGQGGSIPLCTLLQNAMPQAEILLYGVEEPRCLIHAPNESVDPSEIEHMALAEALLLRALGDAG